MLPICIEVLFSRRMSETRREYRDYVIHARPFQLAADGRWSPDFTITQHNGDHANVGRHDYEPTFETREEAIENCFVFGARIIDGI
jgi:Domain of unknown function (DUF6566)